MAEEVNFRDFELEIEEVGKEVDRGSYAIVLELKYKGLKCAGKELYPVFQEKSSYQAKRYLEECKLLSKVKHPNIVQFLGIYPKTGSTFPILVMEFLPTNLTKCLERYGILPDKINFSILYDVSLGLAYLHGQTPAIVHRDLSANNILLSSNMSAKIADLGVAKILNLTPLQVSRMTGTPGTPAYMPPEVMEADPKYDTTVDMFSFGVLVMHVLTATWPEPNCAPTRPAINSSLVIGVKEIDRRSYLLENIKKDNPLKDLIKDCLKNKASSRPNASKTTQILSEVTLQYCPSFENRIEMLKKIDVQIKEHKKKIETMLYDYKIKQKQYEDDMQSLKQGHAIEVKRLQDNLLAQVDTNELVLSKSVATLGKKLAEKKEYEILEMQSKLSESTCKLTSLEEELIVTKEDLKQVTSENDQLRKQIANDHKQYVRKMADNFALVEELTLHMKKLQNDMAELEDELKNEKAANERQKMRIASHEALESQLKETQIYLISRKKVISYTWL